MRRIFLGLAGLMLAVITAACSSGNASTALSNRPEPGRPVPAAAVHRLTVLAGKLAKENGGYPVEWATVVVTTRRNPLETRPGGPKQPARYVAYSLIMKGHFVCGGCTGPPGAPTPTGTYLTVVMNVNGKGPGDFGISRYRPAADPHALGPITHLKVLSAPVTATARPMEGPSAQQLAHGHWIRIPPVPIGLCDSLARWDGHALVVIEPAFRPCSSGAAAYDPKTNRWAKSAAPPKLIGLNPLAAWGGGRLIVVSRRTGATVTWSPAIRHWHQIRSVPSANVVSAVWTGRKFLVITASLITSGRKSAHAYALTGNRWSGLPNLPQPRKGRIVGAVAAAGPGAVYAIATIASPGAARDLNVSGSVELLRLAAASWRPVPLSPAVPRSQLALTTVSGGIVAAGSGCLALALCMEEDGAAALLRLGARPETIPLTPAAGVPYPYDIAAGGQAIVVAYQNGLGTVEPPGSGPVPGSSTIYDIAAGRWLPGPTSPGIGGSAGAYWTAYGVVCLGQRTNVGSTHNFGGWLLRPA